MPRNSAQANAASALAVTETEDKWADIERRCAQLYGSEPLQAKDRIGVFRRFTRQKNTFQFAACQFLTHFQTIDAPSGESNDRLLALIASPSEPHISDCFDHGRCQQDLLLLEPAREARTPAVNSCHADEPSAHTTWSTSIRL